MEEKSGQISEIEGPTFISNTIFLMKSEDNSSEDKEHDTSYHGDMINLAMEGISQYVERRTAPLALVMFVLVLSHPTFCT